MDSNTPEEWFRRLPRLTRLMACIIFIITLISILQLMDMSFLFLDWTRVYKKLQVWRLLTNYFYIGKFSFSWLFQMYFFITFSSSLEENEIFTSSSKGAYLYFLLFQMAVLNIVSLLLFWPQGKAAMGMSLHFAIIYYWSRRDPWAPVGLWGFNIQAYQLPFAFILFDILTGHSIWDSLMGLFSGHLYHYLRDIQPRGNIDFFKAVPCPAFLNSFVEWIDNFSINSVYNFAGVNRRPQSTTERSTTSTTTGGNSSTATLFSGRGYSLRGN